MIDNKVAVCHFNRYSRSSRDENFKGPWADLSSEEIEADVLTADWVPNRAMWRSKGLKGRRHALEVL